MRSSLPSSSSSVLPAAARLVPLQLYLECQSQRPPIRHSAQQTQHSEWREEKTQAEFVPTSLPAVPHCHTATQSDTQQLFDWDSSLDPLLQLLVGKSVMQAAIEVEQEEQWAHTRRTAAAYDHQLSADGARVARMEREEAERQQSQQADLQVARLDRQRQYRLRTQQMAASRGGHSVAAQLQRRVASQVEAAYDQQERESVHQLLHDEIVSLTVPLHVEQLKARAAIDRCLHI